VIVGKSGVSLFCVASFAINRPAFLRLEWHFALLSALCAGGFVHLAWSKISSGTTLVKVSHVFFSKLTKKCLETLKYEVVIITETCPAVKTDF